MFKRSEGVWACSPKTATVWSHTLHGIALIADCRQSWAPVEAQRANAALCAAAPDLLAVLGQWVKTHPTDLLAGDSLDVINKAVRGHGKGDI